MAEPSPLEELACSHCGSPIRTTAAPGTTVTCDCCGSAYRIPDRSEPPVVPVNLGTVVSSLSVAGSPIVGSTIVVRSATAGTGNAGPVEDGPTAPETDDRPAGPGDGE
jgi:hypothetical protein